MRSIGTSEYNSGSNGQSEAYGKMVISIEEKNTLLDTFDEKMTEKCVE